MEVQLTMIFFKKLKVFLGNLEHKGLLIQCHFLTRYLQLCNIKYILQEGYQEEP